MAAGMGEKKIYGNNMKGMKKNITRKVGGDGGGWGGCGYME